jgi:glycerate kinase
MRATTTGVGELMLEASKVGYTKIIVGLGGSATNDGGIGCCRALGVRFLDKEKNELVDGGRSLSRLDRIENKREETRDKKVKIVALSDVTNVLCGPDGAAHTFAAQKGATPEQVRELDAGLRHYATIIERDLRRNVSEIPGSGAAGGLGAGLIAFCDATVESGIDYVLDLVRFDELAHECDCVITAEGMIDSQTLGGNAALLRPQLGLESLHEISPEGIPLVDSMKNAGNFLSSKIKEVFSAKR